MPAFHGHDDDFLCELQRSVEPPSDTSANTFLKRIVNRIGNGRKRVFKFRWPFGR